MSVFRCCIAVVVVLSFALPSVADDKDEEDQQISKELELKACGTKEKEVNFQAGTDKAQHPAPEQPTDKALVYVIRPSMMGNKIQSKLAVDGDWKGTNRGDNYFFFTLDAGEHYFCSEAENRSVLKLEVCCRQNLFPAAARSHGGDESPQYSGDDDRGRRQEKAGGCSPQHVANQIENPG